MNENIEILKDLTNRLAPLIDYEKNDVIEYKVPAGTCLGFGLFNVPEVSVQKAFLSKGTIFPIHTHKVMEWLMVYKGKLESSINGRKKILDIGAGVYINPEEEHSVLAVEDTWIIGVTIPSDSGYPDE